MTGTDANPQDARGHTWPDVFMWFVKHGFLGLLILAGVVYAFHAYLKQGIQSEKLRQDATRDIQRDLNAANKSVRETYVAITTMNQTIIQSIQDALDTLQNLQARLKQLQEESLKEAAKADEAIAERTKAEEERDEALKDLQQVRRDQDTDKKDRVAKSAPFKEDVNALVSLLPSDEDLTGPEVHALVSKIRTLYLVDPLSLLEAAAKDTSVKNLQALDDLEGLEFDTLKQIATQNEAGFASWMLLEADKDQMLLGLVQVSEYAIHGAIAIDFDQGRVYNIDPLTRLSWVSFPSTRNWDVELVTTITDDLNGDRDYETTPMGPLSSAPGEARRFSDLLPVDLTSAPKVLAGEDPRIRPVPLDELHETNPATYKALLMEEDRAEIAAAMMRRSEAFSASTVIPIALGEGDGDLGNLRQTIVQALNAAVKRDKQKRSALAGENFNESNWGRLAAVALNQRLRVQDLSLSPERLEASVVFVYQDQESGDVSGAKLTLGRAQPLRESGWRITGFSSMPSVRRVPSVRQMPSLGQQEF